MNINDKVKVRLTETGKKILREKEEKDLSVLAKYWAGFGIGSSFPSKQEIDGYYEFQLWELMEIFGGSHMGIAKDQVFVDNKIEMVEKTGAEEKAPKNESLKLLKEELIRARTKFPGNEDLTVALMEEVGELAQATLKCDTENLKKEALQVACVAMRIYEEGDATFTKRVGISQDEKYEYEKELKKIDACLVKCEYDENKRLYRFELVNKYKDSFIIKRVEKPTKQQLRKFVEDRRSRDGWLVKNKEGNIICDDLHITNKESKDFRDAISDSYPNTRGEVSYKNGMYKICFEVLGFADSPNSYYEAISGYKPSTSDIKDLVKFSILHCSYNKELCFKNWKIRLSYE